MKFKTLFLTIDLLMFVSLVQELERIIMAYDGIMADLEQELNHSKERAETLEREVIGLDYRIFSLFAIRQNMECTFCMLKL